MWVPPDPETDPSLQVGDAIGHIVDSTPLHEPFVGMNRELKQVLADKVMVEDWIPSASVRKNNRPSVDSLPSPKIAIKYYSIL